MWVDAVACVGNLELDDFHPFVRIALSEIQYPGEQPQCEQEYAADDEGEVVSCLVHLCILLLKSQLVVEGEGVHGETHHDVGCPHVLAALVDAVLAGLCHPLVIVGTLLVACAGIIVVEVAVADVDHAFVCGQACRLLGDDVADLSHVARLQDVADADGVGIIDAVAHVIFAEEAVGRCQASHRFLVLPQVEVHVGHVDVAEVVLKSSLQP